MAKNTYFFFVISMNVGICKHKTTDGGQQKFPTKKISLSTLGTSKHACLLVRSCFYWCLDHSRLPLTLCLLIMTIVIISLFY